MSSERRKGSISIDPSARETTYRGHNPLEISQWQANEYAKNARANRRERKLADKTREMSRHA